MPARLGAHLVIGLLWLLHFLPLPLLAALGRGLGGLLWRLAGSRRRIALRNLELCFPELDEVARRALAREHFALLGRSLLERGLLWFAPAARLQRLIHLKGNIKLAEQTERPVMWLLPMMASISGACLTLSLLSSSTSETESTTAPTTRPRMLSTITTVKLLYSALSQLNFRRRSTIGTITPRRLTTPLKKGAELAMRVGSS